MDALFAYGTLAFPEVMEAVLGAVLPNEPARVEGWARYRVRGEHYPGIVANLGAATPGTLYTACTPSAMRILDDFEGDLYDRVELVVEPKGDAPRHAHAYVIPAGRATRLTRDSWSPESFRESHLETFLVRCHQFRRSFVESNS